MSDIVPSHPNEIAPSVQALLAAFNKDTHHKLALAPVDSCPIYQRADGGLSRVGHDGWLIDEYADLDKDDAITITPTSVRDTETS